MAYFQIRIIISGAAKISVKILHMGEKKILTPPPNLSKTSWDLIVVYFSSDFFCNSCIHCHKFLQ